jgi:hypothetical protein
LSVTQEANVQNPYDPGKQVAEDLRSFDLADARSRSNRFALVSAVFVALSVAFFFLLNGWLNSFSMAGRYEYIVVDLCRLVVHFCAGFGVIVSLTLACLAAIGRNRIGYVLLLLDLAICVRYVCLLAFTV